MSEEKQYNGHKQSFPVGNVLVFKHPNTNTQCLYSNYRLTPSSNNKTLNARLLARVITRCHYT